MTTPAWLPDKKYYEYSYHKFFNPDVEWKNWTAWDQWTYPDRDLMRFGHIIGKQIQHIKNKRVLDVACHLGYTSLFCLHNDARYVTGTNVRDFELSIAREVTGLAGYSNCNFVNSDLYNLAEFASQCDDHDTVFLCGILYHVNNHYEILQTVAKSRAQTLILESDLSNAIDLGLNAIVHWKSEPTADSTSGYEKNKNSTFVGVPNQRWFEYALQSLGFSIAYNHIIEFSKPNGIWTRRCIMVAQK
jgi:ubiquinone/menaquinone biosynthesis C-methylase UbiE